MQEGSLHSTALSSHAHLRICGLCRRLLRGAPCHALRSPARGFSLRVLKFPAGCSKPVLLSLCSFPLLLWSVPVTMDSSALGHLEGFLFGAVTNPPGTAIGLLSLVRHPGTEVQGHGVTNNVLHLPINSQILHQSNGTTSHSPQHCVRVPACLCPCQHDRLCDIFKGISLVPERTLNRLISI